MAGYKKKTLSSWKIQKIAIVLGIISILSAFIIGFISYRASIHETEKHYQEFYLQKTLHLRYLAVMLPHLKENELIMTLKEHFLQVGKRADDEYFCLLNKSSILLEHSKARDKIGKYAGNNLILGNDNFPQSRLSSLPEIIAKTKKGYVGYYISGRGEQQLAAFVFIPGRNWILGIHRSKDKLIRQVRSGIKFFLIGFIVVCGFLLPLSLGLLAWTFSVAQKKRRTAEEELVKSLNEKEILIKEIHHRVKNNMQIISSLLDLQSLQIDDERTREHFLKSQNRIRSMALIHEMMYKTGQTSEINFKSYINDLKQNIYTSFGAAAGNIEVVTDINDIFLKLNAAIPCALLINEIMTNSFKHAFSGMMKGTIRINFSKNNGMYLLKISDDGIGTCMEKLKNSGTLGFQLIEGLVQQLKGELKLETLKGTEYTITFPSQKE